jgi:hypothetical protein
MTQLAPKVNTDTAVLLAPSDHFLTHPINRIQVSLQDAFITQ